MLVALRVGIVAAAPSDDFVERGVALRGPWQVYEGVILGLDDPLPSAPSFEIVLPVQFGRVKLPDGRQLPRLGAYTLALDVDLPPSREALGVELKYVWGSSALRCRVFGDGAPRDVNHELGSPSADPTAARSLQRWGVVPLPPGRRMHCLLALANFEGSPGMRDAPRLGEFHRLEAKRLADLALDMGLAGVLLAFAVVHLVLSLVRHDRLYVYFAQVSLALAARQAVAGRVYENCFPDSHAINVIWGLDVGSIAFACAGVLMFIGEVIGGHVPVRPRKPLYAIGMVLGLLCFGRTVIADTDGLVLAAEIYLGVVAVLTLGGLTSALVRRDVPDVALLVLGLGIAMASGVYEVFAARRLVPEIPFIPVGIVSFVSCQALLLARRTQRVHESTERLARELERKNAELARLDEQKDAFVAATSHELKTPLHGMIGLMEGVRDQVTGAPRGSLDLAIASGRRLDTQISGLLDFAKLRRDELVLDRRPIDTAVLVRTVIEASQALVGTKALELRPQIASGVAPILGDEVRVRQVLFHVVGNAVKFTDRGRIDVRAESQGEVVRLVVSDTGVGIAPESQARVFDAFTQEAPVDTRAAGGTGLGLAISKRLVELHGGTISVASALGAGTTVTIELPASGETPTHRHEPLEPAAPLPLEYSAALTSPALGDVSAVFDRRSMQIVLANGARDDRLTILAVDDDPVNQRVLETQLRPAGYRVVVAGDGVEALDAFRDRGPFDLVLLDVMMPRMSGLEALRAIRTSTSQAELPVILLTAKQQQQDVLAGFDAGANDYLTKPFSKKELLARIETHLTVAKTNQALRRFVPHEFLEALGRKNVTEVKLGDSVERRLAILFGDIRDFTSISEGLGPEETFRFVNACLRRVTPFVREGGGFVDKFIGDAVLALFPESARAAVEAAVAIERSVDAIDEGRPFRFGIGIHVGTTMMGTIGDERRFEATVISDAVNQAARIEGMTKHLHARVLVSGEVADEIGHGFVLRPLGLVRAVGRDKPIAIVEVLDADPEPLRDAKRAHLDRFAEAVEALRTADFASALVGFRAVLEAVPEDGCAAFFAAAAAEGLAGAPVVRDGAVVLNRK
jgi:two-component system sensor histidine kinase ChiS